MKNKLESVKLKLDSPKIPSNKFLQGAKTFFDLLEEITDSLYNSKKSIFWSVAVHEGSAVIEAIPERPNDPKVNPAAVIGLLKTGLRMIEGGSKRPKHFNDKILEKIKNLSDLSEPKGMKISIIVGKHSQEISPKIRSNVNEFIQGSYSSIGTVEGQLLILAKRTHLEIEIRDEVSGHLVRCFMPQEMLDEAKDAFARRVAVTGTIRYRHDGTPVNIEATKLFRFPFNRELPRHEDVRGIFRRSN